MLIYKNDMPVFPLFFIVRIKNYANRITAHNRRIKNNSNITAANLNLLAQEAHDAHDSILSHNRFKLEFMF